LAYVLIFNLTLNAASRLTDDFAELVKLADAVVEVNIDDVRSQESTPPRSVASLTIHRVFKGKVNPGPLDIAFIGGFDGPYRVIAPGQPHFIAGQSAVLLLSRSNDGASWHVLGGDAGQINVAEDGAGQRLARRASGRFEFYVADANSFSGSRAVKSASLRFQHMELLLNTVLKTGRPMIESAAASSPLSTAALAAIPTLENGGDAGITFGVRVLLFLAATAALCYVSRLFRMRA